jgi:hypothetical protein
MSRDYATTLGKKRVALPALVQDSQQNKALCDYQVFVVLVHQASGKTLGKVAISDVQVTSQASELVLAPKKQSNGSEKHRYE